MIPEKEELIFNTRGYVKFYPINIIGYKREKNGLFFFVAWFFSLKNLRYIVACQKGYRSKVFTQEEQEEVLFYIAKYYTDSDTLRKVLNKKEIIREKSSRSKSDPSDKLNEDTICSLLQKAAQSVIEEENSVELIPQTEKSAFSLKGKNLPKIQKQEVPKKKKEVNATNSWWGTLVFGGAVIAIVVAIIWNKKFTKTR